MKGNKGVPYIHVISLLSFTRLVIRMLRNHLKYALIACLSTKMDETTRYLSLLVNIQEKMGRSDFRALTFLAKDHVTGKYENCLDLFRDLERKEVIKCEPPKIDFWFLVEAFHLMGRSDLESLVRVAVGPIQLSKSGAFVSEKR